MIKAIIVDDESSACEAIETLVNCAGHDVSIDSICNTVEQAILAINKHQPEVIFLDIELADGSGFEVLENFPHLKARVIFITAYEHYALKAIKYNAFDYILKPVDPAELEAVLQKVADEIKKSAPFPDTVALLEQIKGRGREKIAVPTKNGLQYHTIGEIICIQGEGSYANMYLTGNKTVLVSKIIKDFEVSLADKGFLRVHKSFLVNVNHIEEYRRDEGGSLIMSNGKQIPISSKNRDEVLLALKKLSDTI